MGSGTIGDLVTAHRGGTVTQGLDPLAGKRSSTDAASAGFLQGDHASLGHLLERLRMNLACRQGGATNAQSTWSRTGISRVITGTVFLLA